MVHAADVTRRRGPATHRPNGPNLNRPQQPDIVLPSAVRWVRRRLTLIRATLLAIVTLLPDRFGGDAHLGAVRAALDTDHALVMLRARAATVLSALPRPLGFARHVRPLHAPRPRRQHGLGADPAAPSG